MCVCVCVRVRVCAHILNACEHTHTTHQVKKITSDIKQLDNAKKHLTDSIRTLERLRFLITNLDDLQ